MFGSGTACVVCPIKEIVYQGERHQIPTMEEGAPITTMFYKQLTDIQVGIIVIMHLSFAIFPDYLFIYLLCHIYLGVPHQCAALFSLGLLHYMHDKTNINQHTFSSNTVTTLTTWYIHHYMHNVNYLYMFLITVVTCRCRFMFGQHYVQCI